MLAASLVISIAASVTQISTLNWVSKSGLNRSDDRRAFNLIGYFVCVILFGLFLMREKPSLYTAALGLTYGILTAVGIHFKMMAFTTGPMHISNLLITSSMIIPALSGIFFGEKFSVGKLLVVFLLLFFIWLSLDRRGGVRFGKYWLLYCLITFTTQGGVGVVQKIHQSSPHKGESNWFLFTAFLCAAVVCAVQLRGRPSALKIGKKYTGLALLNGLCFYLPNLINLKLSGILPSQLIFPLNNGSVIILSSVLSFTLFHEKATKTQLIGLIGGIVTLIAICIIP